MAKQFASPASRLISRLTLYRLIVICGILLLAYLFIYKIDIDTTAARLGNIIIVGSGSNQNNEQGQIVPLISKKDPEPVPVNPPEPVKKEEKVEPPTTTITTTTTTIVTTSSAQKNESQAFNVSDQPKEAFVTFSNNNPTYLALLKVMLESVHTFSTRPVIAFGIDVDLDIDLKQFPRVIKRRIKQSDCGPVRTKENKMIEHILETV